MTAPLDLDALSNQVRPLDEEAAAAARDRLSALSTPAGSLGRLADLAGWLAGAQGVAPPRDLARARVVVFAGDHGIAKAGVSAYPPETTARLVALIGSGDAAVSVLARVAGATVRVVDVAVDADTAADLSTHKVRRGSGRIDRQDALTLAEAERAFAAGVAIADEEVDGGADLLIPGELGIGVTAVAAVLVAALTDTEPVKVIGRGSGIDDPTWMRKLTAIRDGLRRGRPFVADPVALLAASGGADLAAMAGFLVQAAVRRTPVLLDGVASAAAGLVASAIAPAAPAWWLAAHRSSEPAHRVALEWLDLRPVVDLGVRLDDGTGALLVLPLLRSAVRSCAEIATAEQAGIHSLSTTRPAGTDPDATGADGTDLDADHLDATARGAAGLDSTGDPTG